jgi:UPF0716 protein FxsA
MGLVLLILFIALPIAELYVIIQVGQAIGVLPTLAILLLDGLLGAALARSQGRMAWARFNQALAEGRAPARETFDGAMIIVGGAFLLAPGFITDAVGLALLIPPTRALVRGLVTRMAKRRASFTWTVVGGPPRRPPARGYDYEGSATEVTDPGGRLSRGEPDE